MEEKSFNLKAIKPIEKGKIIMLYENNNSNLIGLKEVIVKNVWEEENIQHIEIEMPRRTHKCPCCGVKTNRVHDYRKQSIKDCPAYGRQVMLHLRKRRYACVACGKRFFEDNSFLPRYHRITNRKCLQILNEFRETVSAAHIARRHNLSVTSVLRYFNMVHYSCKKLPKVLSIDEFKGDADREKYQSITTDAENHKVLDILPNRKKNDLIRYFKKFKNRYDVKYVVIDMNSYFKEVAESCFPKATIVIDRYHVTRQVVWAMERVRKEDQKHLPQQWRKFCKHSKTLLAMPREKLTDEQKEKVRIILGLSDRLDLAYDLKNEYFEMMHSPNSEIAKKRMASWIYRAECSGLDEFNSCTKTLHNWGKYILNSFDCPYSNGFTEGCNNKTKVLKRACYGIKTFKLLRSRILHCHA